MAGISRYETIALGLTAAFVLFTGGWFWAHQSSAEPYEVQVSGGAQSAPAPAATSEADEEPERPDSLLEGEVININSAGLYDLQRLPGIGEVRAQAILDYREANGPFQTVDGLDAVDGIGQGIIDGLRDYAQAGPAGEGS